jgi:hypothetical protein
MFYWVLMPGHEFGCEALIRKIDASPAGKSSVHPWSLSGFGGPHNQKIAHIYIIFPSGDGANRHVLGCTAPPQAGGVAHCKRHEPEIRI